MTSSYLLSQSSQFEPLTMKFDTLLNNILQQLASVAQVASGSLLTLMKVCFFINTIPFSQEVYPRDQFLVLFFLYFVTIHSYFCIFVNEKISLYYRELPVGANSVMLTNKYLTLWFCPTILCWSAALMYHVYQLHCSYFNTHSADIRLSSKVNPFTTG